MLISRMLDVAANYLNKQEKIKASIIFLEINNRNHKNRGDIEILGMVFKDLLRIFSLLNKRLQKGYNYYFVVFV